MPLDLGAIPAVATQFQNDDHRLEADLINRCVEALQGDVASATAALEALRDHTVAHFAREDEAMARTGFPAFPVHRAEHQRVLAEFQAELATYAADPDPARLRAYLEQGMVPWFLTHIQTMDTITARWLSQHER